MDFAFIVDPLPALKAYKDSSVAMMREAARRGHSVHAVEARDLYVRGGAVRAPASRLALRVTWRAKIWTARSSP